MNICYAGYADLPGPLCHGVIDKDGRVHLVGPGDDDVLRAVLAEDYAITPPRPNENNTNDNRAFYGFEIVALLRT